MIAAKQVNNNYNLSELVSSSHTAKEIASQPKLWRETYHTVLSQKEPISRFLSNIYEVKGLQIILTGAGTSAFIGEILQNPFYRNTQVPTRAISTTDIVTHPGDFFQKDIPTLLVSFARSGDSPESLATYELAEKLFDNVFHLVITCNPEGKLAEIAQRSIKSFLFVLPDGTNDKALAMTSSFTSMTLAGLLISDIKNIEANKRTVDILVGYGQHILDHYAEKLSHVANLDFKKTVFLGSGPLKGSAQESHLKVIELTDGYIYSHYDSFLGFRHGPKAIIDEFTLLVYLFSREKYVSGYEADLVSANTSTEHFMYSIGIGQFKATDEKRVLDLNIEPGGKDETIPDEYFSICSVLPAQIIGLYKSLAIGLTPDSPSKSGGIHRVVQGVNIYPY
jgi:tagatose-6-phosphate ketose/aldose isomerase